MVFLLTFFPALRVKPLRFCSAARPSDSVLKHPFSASVKVFSSVRDIELIYLFVCFCPGDRGDEEGGRSVRGEIRGRNANGTNYKVHIYNGVVSCGNTMLSVFWAGIEQRFATKSRILFPSEILDTSTSSRSTPQRGNISISFFFRPKL